MFTKQHPSLGY